MKATTIIGQTGRPGEVVERVWYFTTHVSNYDGLVVRHNPKSHLWSINDKCFYHSRNEPQGWGSQPIFEEDHTVEMVQINDYS